MNKWFLFLAAISLIILVAGAFIACGDDDDDDDDNDDTEGDDDSDGTGSGACSDACQKSYSCFPTEFAEYYDSIEACAEECETYAETAAGQCALACDTDLDCDAYGACTDACWN